MKLTKIKRLVFESKMQMKHNRKVLLSIVKKIQNIEKWNI